MNNWKKFIAGFDLHGDMQDPNAVAKFFKFVDIWKPDIRVFGGDLIDFRPLRRGAGDSERAESMGDDVRMGMEFLDAFHPQYFLEGNHDFRARDLAANGAGIAADHAGHLCAQIDDMCRSLKTQILPYHKRLGVLQIGHLKMLHGFHSGVYAARQTALIYGASLFGHSHTVDEHPIPGLERRVARCCGCLCRTDMDYNSRQPNSLRQSNGWAFGVLSEETGIYHSWQAEKIGDVWMIPTDIVEL